MSDELREQIAAALRSNEIDWGCAGAGDLEMLADALIAAVPALSGDSGTGPDSRYSSVLADVATVLVNIEDGKPLSAFALDRLSNGWQRLLRHIAALAAALSVPALSEGPGLREALTPLQREVDPEPSCARCERAITRLGDLYRCAHCHAAFHLTCIYEHFGWSVNGAPDDDREAHAAARDASRSDIRVLHAHVPLIKFDHAPKGAAAYFASEDGLPYLACACGWDDRGDTGWLDHLDQLDEGPWLADHPAALAAAPVPDTAPPAPALDVVREALTSEDDIAHGEAYTPARGGLGYCAYCRDKWPCRTQRGIDRLLARLARRPAERAPEDREAGPGERDG